MFGPPGVGVGVARRVNFIGMPLPQSPPFSLEVFFKVAIAAARQAITKRMEEEEEEEKGKKEPVSDRSKIREIEIFGDCFEFKVKDFLAPKKPL